MNARLAVTLVAAVLMAGAAAWLAQQYISQQAQRTPVAVATAPLVVAAGEIPFASKIGIDDVKLVQWPRDAIPAGAAQELHQVEGKIAQRSFLRGEPITRDRLRDHLGGSTLSAIIKPGLRAISVRVDDVAGVAGFIFPANRVDILGAQADGRSYTVLSGVNVLAIDQEASPETDEPSVVRSLTLEVSPAQAEILDQAGHRGPLRFTLRNPLDVQPAQQDFPKLAPPASSAVRPVSPPPVPSGALVPREFRAPSRPGLTVIEWTGKGKVLVDQCLEYPCFGGRKGDQQPTIASGRTGSLESISPLHQGVLDALSTSGQLLE